MLLIIGKGIENKMTGFIIYKSMIRPYLEVLCGSGYPISKRPKKSWEKVENRTAKMIRGLEHFPYEAKLKYLGLFSVENW